MVREACDAAHGFSIEHEPPVKAHEVEVIVLCVRHHPTHAFLVRDHLAQVFHDHGARGHILRHPQRPAPTRRVEHLGGGEGTLLDGHILAEVLTVFQCWTVTRCAFHQ